jgi:dTDP-4-dehydrorhamnose 3,5-epimerase
VQALSQVEKLQITEIPAMNIIKTPIEGLLILEPQVHGDARGWFMESFSQQRFDAAVGHSVKFVQDNHSHSQRGVLRGLHYQLAPHAQGKLVRVASGVVWDVAVDLRLQSATFGHWYGVELSAHNQRQFWVPEGFAHGFVTLSEAADFLYKTTNYYAPGTDRAIRWDDATLAIQWPALPAAIGSVSNDAQTPAKNEGGFNVSAKDQVAATFEAAKAELVALCG